MRKHDIKNIALIGNPNCGKSSLFNHLTGLNQKVGNFPGVTVEKKTGICTLANGEKLNIIDLPGTYSLYPHSLDERVVFDTLVSQNNPEHPDLVVVIIDASNIKRNLLLYTQIADLGIPVLLVLNMLDVATSRGQRVSPTAIARYFSVPTISLNARTGYGVDMLKKALVAEDKGNPKRIFSAEKVDCQLELTLADKFKLKNEYLAHLLLIQFTDYPGLNIDEKKYIEALIHDHKFNPELSQSKEILLRYKKIDKAIQEGVVYNLHKNRNFTDRLDKFSPIKYLGISYSSPFYLSFFNPYLPGRKRRWILSIILFQRFLSF